jgi:hypothetical protein
MSAPSRMLRRGVLLGTAGAVLAGCGGGAPPTPPPAAVAPAPTPVVRPKEPDTGKALPPIAYEPKGRRDPFTPIFLGKDNAALSVSAVKLTGVVGGPRRPGRRSRYRNHTELGHVRCFGPGLTERLQPDAAPTGEPVRV